MEWIFLSRPQAEKVIRVWRKKNSSAKNVSQILREIDNELLLWTGAKLVRAKREGRTKWMLCGYASDCRDINEITQPLFDGLTVKTPVQFYWD